MIRSGVDGLSVKDAAGTCCVNSLESQNSLTVSLDSVTVVSRRYGRIAADAIGIAFATRVASVSIRVIAI